MATTTGSSSDRSKSSFQTWTFDRHCPSMEWTTLHPVQLHADNQSTEEPQLVVIMVHHDADAEQEDEEPLTGWIKSLDTGLHGTLTKLRKEHSKTTFKKAGGVTPTFQILVGDHLRKYVLCSLGRKDDLDKKKETTGFVLGKAIAQVVTSEKNIEIASVHVPDNLALDKTFIRNFSTMFYQELYSDNRYRTGDKVKRIAEHLKKIKLVTEGVTIDGTALEDGKKLATGIYLTRDIVNAPHNVLNSESLAETAKRVAQDSNGLITCQVLGKAECEKRGMGAYLGVARGSETEPQFIHLIYRPPTISNIKKRVGIVGKGLLFDTGGYNIKTGMMELMKFDCGGSAAVLGAARALGMLAPDHGVEVHFVIAACSNMINSKAIVPSDILTASNGKTIEVLNTDAEGRLTMADALVYCDQEIGCEKIIELSTLTGSCMIALGKEICGAWTHDDDLATELADVSKMTGEKSWRMPMATEYNEQLESKIADISNIGTRYGGSITAALFLQHFVDEKKPFAHLDIAGPVWNEKTGATGFGAKLIVEWVARQGKK